MQSDGDSGAAARAGVTGLVVHGAVLGGPQRVLGSALKPSGADDICALFSRGSWQVAKRQAAGEVLGRMDRRRFREYVRLLLRCGAPPAHCPGLA